MKKKIQLSRVRAKAIRCLQKGSYRLADPHVKEQMKTRDVVINDLFSVVLCEDAVIEEQWEGKPPETRYAFETDRFRVIVTFESPNRLVFITV